MSEQIKNHLTANLDLRRKQIMVNNFIGGLAWGAGSVIGAGIVVAILGIFLNALGVFEPFKMFFEQLQAIPQLNEIY